MPATTRELRPIPGLEVVGRGVYLRPNQAYQLKEVLVPNGSPEPYYSAETGTTYAVPKAYEVNDSPPMPATQALNQSLIEESWDRFEKRTSLDTSAAVSNGPFSVDVSAGQTKHLRQEEESYYALRTSFIPLWTVYVPNTDCIGRQVFDEIDVPVPFDHAHRQEYQRFFQRFGTHYVPRAWVGGKATLALIVTKQSKMTRGEIQAGLKASMAGMGGASVNTADAQSREKLQSNSECTVLGKGGDELKLAALSTLDNVLYNEWLDTVKVNPQVIEFEAVGIWTLVPDQARAMALMEAYREETLVSSIRAVFNLDNQIHFFEDEYFHLFDLTSGQHHESREEIRARWPGLYEVGFERVDAAFLGKYLTSQTGEDLSRKLFFFNRDKYVRWDVDAGGIDPGYPRLISDGWPGLPFGRIDAAVNVDPESVYFFCGNKYARFNTMTNRVDDGYPESVQKRWVGVTFDRIDAATYWGNAKVYFFCGNQYIRYDTVMWRADPGFPKTVSSHYVQDWKFFE